MGNLTKAQQAERALGLEKLRDLVPEGAQLYTILRSVSSSGMSRVISVVVVGNDGEIRNLDWHIDRAGLYKRTPNGAKRDGLKVRGCGMDMGYAIVYDVSSALFGDGYKLKQSWL